MKPPELIPSPDRPRLRYPYFGRCAKAGAPLSPRQADQLFQDELELDWADAIDRLKSIQGGQALLLKLMVKALEKQRLLRWVALAARLEEVAGRHPQSEALKFAERWIREGDDPLRYEAYRHAEKEEFATPGAKAAMVTFVAGPSLGPEGSGQSPPGPNLARNVAAGILMSFAGSEALADSGVARVNSIGLELARGGDGRAAARAALAGEID